MSDKVLVIGFKIFEDAVAVNHKAHRLLVLGRKELTKRAKISKRIHMKKVIILTLTSLFAVSLMPGLTLPVFLQWSSSNSVLIPDLDDYNTTKVREVYILKTGIDTLFSDNARFRFVVANQEKIVKSQILIYEAALDFHHKALNLRLSLEDIGRGKGYYCYDYRIENPFYEQNPLFQYRWHGLQSRINYYDFSAGFALGGNDYNRVLSEVKCSFGKDTGGFEVFGFHANRDNHWNSNVIHLGAEGCFSAANTSLKSSVVYALLPKEENLTERHNWHAVAQIELNSWRFADLILNAEFKTRDTDDKDYLLYSAAVKVPLSYHSIHLGYRQVDDFGEKTINPYCDIWLTLFKRLKVSMFYDYIINDYKGNHRIGIQTRVSYP